MRTMTAYEQQVVALRKIREAEHMFDGCDGFTEGFVRDYRKAINVAYDVVAQESALSPELVVRLKAMKNDRDSPGWQQGLAEAREVVMTMMREATR